MARKMYRLYLVTTFLLWFAHSFFFGTYVLYMRERGLDLSEIALVNVFYMLGIICFEVPTGLIADCFGRRKTIALGCMIFSLSMFGFSLAQNFWQMVFAEVLGAFGSACLSGSLTAWVTDSMRYFRFWGRMNRVYSSGAVVKTSGIIMGSVLGGYIAKADLSYPFLASSIAMVLVGCFCFFFLEEHYYQKSYKKGVVRLLSEALSYVRADKDIRDMIIFSGICWFAYMPLNMYWQVYFSEDYVIQTEYFGWIFFGIAFFSLLGSRYSWLAFRFIGDERRAVLATQMITVVGIALAISVSFLPAIMFFFYLHEIGRGAFEPLRDDYINHRINSADKRATVFSFNGMIVGAFSVVSLLLNGWLAESISVRGSWFLSLVILIIAVLFFGKKPEPV